MQLMLNVQAVISGSSVRFERCWKIFIIVFPYVVLVAVVVINIVMIIIQPLNKFNIVDYCSMDSVLLGAITAFGTILFVIPILVINVVLFIRIRRHSTTFRTSNNRYSRIMFIRATCFNGFGLIALVIGILFGVFFVEGSSSVNGVGGMNIIFGIVMCSANSYSADGDLVKIHMPLGLRRPIQASWSFLIQRATITHPIHNGLINSVRVDMLWMLLA
ncbi:hypothetical protein BT96DRAFT_981536 [Gymnopus androsaceus JB14]|uniref:Uncharacterized protein n=1 Tax=Gymnopus androsaceus JB14 TaxID=1447944 RepID=A0A6A4GPC4_9AGAR|nr:hypothetical protein BT96DRAFT_981536 [Gymnopus androsaceus JB14]